MARPGRPKGTKNVDFQDSSHKSISLPQIYWDALETIVQGKGISVQKFIALLAKEKCESLGLVQGNSAALLQTYLEGFQD